MSSRCTASPESHSLEGRFDVMFYRGERPDVHRASRRLFGRKLNPWEYAGLAGALDRASVEVGTLEGDLYLEACDPGGRLFRAIHYVRSASCGPVLVIDALHIFSPTMQQKGLGLSMLRRQLDCALALGVRRIETRAGRRDGENGYYTWPRFGFDGPLPIATQNSLPRGFSPVRRVLDLFRFKRGRRWWRQNGTTIDVVFDLTRESRSWKAFAKYAGSVHRGGTMPPS